MKRSDEQRRAIFANIRTQYGLRRTAPYAAGLALGIGATAGGPRAIAGIARQRFAQQAVRRGVISPLSARTRVIGTPLRSKSGAALFESHALRNKIEQQFGARIGQVRRVKRIGKLSRKQRLKYAAMQAAVKVQTHPILKHVEPGSVIMKTEALIHKLL